MSNSQLKPKLGSSLIGELPLPGDIIRFPQRCFCVRSCKIKILLVVEKRFTFNHNFGFSFSLLKNILSGNNIFNTSVKVHTAHRGDIDADSVGVDTSNFKFTDIDLREYSQIWLFGYHDDTENMDLEPLEIQAIEQFMDDGGGIFATGDHEELGNQLCGNIKRVKSMRLWSGSDVPNASDETRNDTNQKNLVTNAYAADNQSDIYPQHIIAHYDVFGNPHPILSAGASNTINILPDHPHEGECRLPDTVEYDQYPDGFFFKPLPVIVATSTNNTESTKGGSDSKPYPKCFPAICAYDGRRANVGRIVTDATWHHFLNYNLEGFYGSPNQDNYETISRYYNNIAMWIADQSSISCSFICYCFILIHNARLEIFFPEKFLNKPPSDIDGQKLYEIGSVARQIINDQLGSAWDMEIFNGILGIINPDLEKKIQTWFKTYPNQISLGTEFKSIHSDVFLNIIYGNMITTLARKEYHWTYHNKIDDKNKKEPFTEKEIIESLTASIDDSLKLISDEIVKLTNTTEDFQKFIYNDGVFKK